MGTAAGRVLRLWDRNGSCAVRLTQRTDLKRGLCSKGQEDSAQKPMGTASGQSKLKMPGHQITNWDKKVLVWSGRFKKAEDIPETVSFEMIGAARSNIRVKVSYLMIALTIAGCIVMVIEGKRGSSRQKTIVSQNIERKMKLTEATEQDISAKP
uniref:Family with sequence similarity 162 member A n=1 Tax=Sphenodon punctatus TaxID=8508 RepID=A0A8D0GID0_SPHPU